MDKIKDILENENEVNEVTDELPAEETAAEEVFDEPEDIAAEAEAAEEALQTEAEEADGAVAAAEEGEGTEEAGAAETADIAPEDKPAKKGKRSLAGLFRKRAKREPEEDEIRIKGGTRIKYRILRMSTLSVCIAVVAMQIFSAISTFTSYDKSYSEQAESLTTAYIETIQTRIKSLTYELEAVRSNTGMQTVVDEKLLLSARRQKLSEIAQTTMFTEMTLADANGDTYSETNIADLDYFQRALSGINTLSSPMIKRKSLVDAADQQLMFMAVRYKNILFEGVLVGAIEPSFMSQGLDSVSGGNVIVLDSEGVVVAGSDMANVINSVNLKESDQNGYVKLADAMLSQETGTVHYNVNGTEYIAAYCPIELTNGWTIAVSLDCSDIYKELIINLIIGLIIGVVIILGTAAIGTGIADKIAKPITMTAGRLRKLSEGNISEEFYVAAAKDETMVLADSLTETIKELSRYINDIKQVLASIAEGNLTAHSEIEYKGDFVAIGNSLESITASLNESIAAVKDSVESIKSGSAQVAEGSRSLSDTAAREAEAVDGIVSVIDKIREKADRTADISSKVLSVTNEAADSAEAGGALMKELTAAISNINEKSEAISAVIKTIDSIAFQTNILAINASIEAARAGEAGRGFAVVAEEVGNLANMSADAVKQTAQLINDSVGAVKTGTQIADKAEKAIISIVSDVSKVAEHMSQIVEAADEQKKAAAHITESMSKIDEGMHSTTATAERSAASSVQLSELAVSLSGEVDKFITE